MNTGSICLTDMIEYAKLKHSAFNKGKNGKVYVNVIMWENEEPDKHGNSFALQLNPDKDAPQGERGVYIGNLKRIDRKPQPLGEADMDEIPNADDLPF